MDGQSKYLKGKIRPPKAVRAYRAGQAPDTESSESEDKEPIDKKSLASLETFKTLHTVPTTLALGADFRSTIIKGGFKTPGQKEGASIQSQGLKDSLKTVTKSTEKTEAEKNKDVLEEKVLEKGEVEVVERRRKPIQQLHGVESKQIPAFDRESEPEEHLGKRKPLIQQTVDSKIESQNQRNIGDQSESDSSEEESEDNIFQTAPTAKISRPVFINSELRQVETFDDVQHARQEQDKNLLKASIAGRNMSLVVESQKERGDAVDDALSDSEIDLPNDSTEDEDVAYEKWKIRELSRLKRDREEQEKIFKEKEAIERRRMMTDEERAQDDKRIGKYKQDQKSHYRFMQKHYSMGIYNRDDDDPLFKRDYNIAVGEDLFDKSVLPSIKQVRRGDEHKKGKSKYTHLVAEDTTNFDPEWVPAEELRDKFKNMTAGYKNSNQFERPSKYR